MRKKIDDGGFQTPYRLRKQVVEPVFGQIKQARGFRQFLLRGVAKVRSEWAMICTAHNTASCSGVETPPEAGYDRKTAPPPWLQWLSGRAPSNRATCKIAAVQ